MYKVNININKSLSATNAINTVVVPQEEQIIEDTRIEGLIISVVDLIKRYNVEPNDLTLTQVLKDGRHVANISYNGVFWEFGNDYGDNYWDRE